MDMRRSEFVLAADGTLKRPASGLLFLPESSEERDGRYVHPDVVADASLLRRWKRSTFGRLDQRGRLRAHVARMNSGKINSRRRRGTLDADPRSAGKGIS